MTSALYVHSWSLAGLKVSHDLSQNADRYCRSLRNSLFEGLNGSGLIRLNTLYLRTTQLRWKTFKEGVVLENSCFLLFTL